MAFPDGFAEWLLHEPTADSLAVRKALGHSGIHCTSLESKWANRDPAADERNKPFHRDRCSNDFFVLPAALCAQFHRSSRAWPDS